MNSHSSAKPSEELEPSEFVSYLHCRMVEEADAAAKASSMEATIIHVTLATAYAKRLCAHSGWPAASADRQWAGQHRVW